MPDNLFSQNSLLCSVMGTELHSSVWQTVSVPCFTSASLFLFCTAVLLLLLLFTHAISKIYIGLPEGVPV